MKFGIVFEVSVPRPFRPGVEKMVVDNCIEQAVLADQLGFDQVWAVEHHFLEEISHCSAPEMLLAAIAMRTEQIRLGLGIAVCVPQFSHPARIAERAAMLDVLSGGRAEIGTGRSATWTELGGFAADPDETKKTWDEYVRAIPRMWTQPTYSHQGRSFSMPERAIVPKPLQDPHPPLWVAVTSPGTEVDAADRGLGCLGLVVGGMKRQEKTIATYRRRIQLCDPVGSFVNEQVNTVNFMYCHEDPAHAMKRGAELSDHFNYLAPQQLFVKEIYPTQSYATDGLFSALRQESTSSGDSMKIPDGIAIGDPESLIRSLKQWESIGVDRVVFILNSVETIPQAEVLDSLRLFAREVMPAFGHPPVAGSVPTSADEVA